MTKKRATFASTYLNARSLPFWLIHASAVGLLFVVPFELSGLALSALVYFIGMFFVTGVYHRYFSHRTYKTSRAFQFVLAWCAQTVCQKGVLWWASSHRHHHKFSDQPEDLHSVVQSGFWWSHVGWFLSDQHDKTNLDGIKDFARYPELRLLNHSGLDILPAILYGLGTYLVGGTYGFLYASAIPLTLLWHGTFSINSLAHVIGRRRYKTTDESKNSLALALITHGEGWHNNHHHYQRSARQGFRWYQIDVTYYILRLLSAVRLIRDIAPVPKHIVEDRPSDKALALAKRTERASTPLTPVASARPAVAATSRPPSLAAPPITRTSLSTEKPAA